MRLVDRGGGGETQVGVDEWWFHFLKRSDLTKSRALMICLSLPPYSWIWIEWDTSRLLKTGQKGEGKKKKECVAISIVKEKRSSSSSLHNPSVPRREKLSILATRIPILPAPWPVPLAFPIKQRKMSGSISIGRLVLTPHPDYSQSPKVPCQVIK